MKLKILVIDGDPILCKAFVIALSSSEWTVDSVTSATKGIEIAKRNHYDLLIADIQVAEGNGFSMLREIRKDLPDIRVIATTCQSCVDIHDEDFLREINGFYPKPIGLAMIKRAVKMEYKKGTS